MDCPNCGRMLSRLAEVLAHTELGTNCPYCWTRLRRKASLSLRVLRPKAAGKNRRAPLRRAA